MSTFGERIEDYIGTFSDTAALSDWLSAGAKQLIELIPIDKILDITENVTDAGSGIDVSNKRVIRAHKSGYGATWVDPSFFAQISDSDSIHYASSTDPAWTKQDVKAYIFPNGGTIVAVAYPDVVYSDEDIAKFPDEMEHLVVLWASKQAVLSLVASSIKAMGDELVPTAPTAPTDPSFTYTDAVATSLSSVNIDFTGIDEPTYDKPLVTLSAVPSLLTISASPPSSPSVPDISYTDAVLGDYSLSSVGDFGAAPTYTKPIVNIPSTISSFTIGASIATLGALPTIDYVNANLGDFPITAIGNLGTVPTFTKPTVTLPSAPSDLVVGAEQPTTPITPVFSYSLASLGAYGLTAVGDLGTVPDYTKPTSSASFTSAETDIRTDEDLTKGATELQLQAEQLKEYNIDINNELNEFNKDLSIYQSTVQKAIKNAELAQTKIISEASKQTDLNIQNQLQETQTDIEEYLASLRRYEGEIQSYGTRINKDVNEYSARVQKWAKDRETLLNQYNLDIQNEVAEFNKELEIYKSTTQKAIEDARLLQESLLTKGTQNTNLNVQNAVNELNSLVQEYSSILNKFQTEVNGYSQEVNAEVNEYSQNLQAWTTDRQTLLNQYSLDIQNELNEFNQENVEYQASIQRAITDANIEAARILSEAGKSTDLSIQNQAQDLVAQIQDYTLELQKFGQDISLYSQNVNKEVSEFRSNLDRYTTESNVLLQEYATNIQNELNEFNKEALVYQTETKKATDQAEIDLRTIISDAERADNIDVVNRSKQLEEQVSEYSAFLQKYLGELNAYQNQANIYATDIGKYLNQSQAYVNLHTKLDQEYMMLLKVYTGA